MSRSKQPEKRPEKKSDQSAQSPAERISFLIACAILAGVLGIVLFLWGRDSFGRLSHRNPQPPTLAVTSTVENRQGLYYVPFTVTNTGGETAEAVQIIAELSINGKVVESGEQQIDFLSSQEEAEGAFIFTQAPSSGKLIVRTASYKLP
jgi:uncharacterized protein (TIGR02588 family)